MATTVPFELRSGFLIVVQGRIGTIDGLRFILDTGATRSVIDAKLAKRLRQRRLENGATHGFDKIIPAKVTDLSDLTIGPLHVRSLSVLVTNLAEVSSFAQDIDGLIGLDFLSQSAAFTIDYQAKTVSFHLAEGEDHRPSTIGCLLMQLDVQGLPVDLVVDTGLPGIVLYRNRLHARLPGLRVIGGAQPVKMGSLHLTLARLSDVSLNGTTVDRNVYFVDENAKTAIPGVDGGIGPVELKAKWLKFDFVGSQLLYR